ncbi:MULTISPECIES: deoxyribose-phosphate aldolase [unclassified Clostridium]|uniref:deoxyribose-phosphate aldolase n=1 Tax=unclassified Clostridium TaxID=2614128 RepID=UPI002A74E5C2|nr:deoxyribose-phosphate aldolase [Clostridium sp.]MCI6693074.1 deoxyribose-phosphate aldolase [Clostridium sp.]MDY2632333.1 deoxyribose-phosphate aldolase [Clostridium sp.]MDY4252962.1 deoxyribose-phosphate aldolase [Clostridium sp.]MDY6226885.1 deoxyribose-phosphate aldolase [Clostridium sp.]
MDKNFSINQLCRLIDHTNLKPYASYKDLEKLCLEAKTYNFKMVAINSVHCKLCSNILSGTDIGIGAAISFPLGQTSIETKLFEIDDAINNGATEIDYVINISEVKEKNYDYLKKEMSKIVTLCREIKVTSKVIFENCYLDNAEIIKMCEIANEVHPDFIKTSTGFGTSGATYEDVKLMRDVAIPSIKIKAAGGIRDSDCFLKMIHLGAERIGTSSGVNIINSLKASINQI